MCRAQRKWLIKWNHFQEAVMNGGITECDQIDTRAFQNIAVTG
jgi:hypothetical protein